jgi:hypothetical protein
LDYPPVYNGLDYLRSVVSHLDHDEPSPQDLKFAVLHLQAAAETLLKARLVAIDWRKVFAKEAEADHAAYQNGDFISCSLDETIKRLRAEGIDIEPEDKGNITHLGKLRNQPQHFGITTGARAVEARATHVLGFLIAFVDDYLRPGLSGSEAQHLDEEMRSIRLALPRIRGYVKIIMDRVGPELVGREWYTMRCPNCSQWALLAEGGEVTCLFCDKNWEAEQFPLEYATGVLGHSLRDYHKGEAIPAEQCPECGAYALVGEAYLVNAPEEQVQYCFGCSTVFQGLMNCMRCTSLYQPMEDNFPICADCLADLG